MAKEVEILKFDKCPACGSAMRLAGTLAEEEKAGKHMRPNVEAYTGQVQGVLIDRALEGTKLVGSSAPAYSISYDVCTNCGCFYAAKIEIGEAVKSMIPRPGNPPLFAGKG